MKSHLAKGYYLDCYKAYHYPYLLKKMLLAREAEGLVAEGLAQAKTRCLRRRPGLNATPHPQAPKVR
jgi:hypothetical protein